jgi:transcriptional regulator with XRE-family HTH domain
VGRQTDEEVTMIEGQGGRPFSEWLRAQLRAKKMSQRQLAQQSGVDHSTISRLIRGDRTPSLETATRLARGLRELRDEEEPTQYLGMIQATRANPVARVEYALRGDETLDEADVRHIMETYLAARVRRLRGAVASVARTASAAQAPRALADMVRTSGSADRRSGNGSRVTCPLPPAAAGRRTD